MKHKSDSQWTVKKYLIIFLCYVGMILLTSFAVVQFLEADLMQATDARLLSAAKGLKYMLAEDFHDRAINKSSISFEEELKNRRAMTGFARDAGLEYVYTLNEKDGEFYFTAPTVTEEEARERKRWYFYPYKDVPPSFVKAYEEGTTVFASYSDQWGSFRSVAVPEISPDGTRYLACADMDISFVHRQWRRSFALAGGVATLLILSSLPLLLIFKRSSMQYTKSILRMNEELLEANKRLRAAEALKSSLLTKISHELRTPLTSIVGFSKIIGRDLERVFTAEVAAGDIEKYQDRIKANLSIISSESGRLSRLINDNLDLCKIESGKMEWHDQELQPESVAISAWNALKGAIEDNPEVAFTVQAASNLPMIFADSDKVHQLLINLLGNALKFTERGKIELRVDQLDGFVRFRIIDTGVGIPAKDVASIFDEFYRSLHSDTVKDVRKGTGLGLALCRQIAEHYGGSISVESEQGKGSTFTVLVKALES